MGHRLDREPDGFDLDLDRTARHLGLRRPTSSHSPIHRAIERTVGFGLARTPRRRLSSARVSQDGGLTAAGGPGPSGEGH